MSLDTFAQNGVFGDDFAEVVSHVQAIESMRDGRVRRVYPTRFVSVFGEICDANQDGRQMITQREGR
jgi:hypothetical protein